MVDGADQGTHDDANAAAGTPDGGEFLILAKFLKGLAALEPILGGQLAFSRIQPVSISKDIVHVYASIASRII
jgi:hypothetical protein